MNSFLKGGSFKPLSKENKDADSKISLGGLGKDKPKKSLSLGLKKPNQEKEQTEGVNTLGKKLSLGNKLKLSKEGDNKDGQTDSKNNLLHIEEDDRKTIEPIVTETVTEIIEPNAEEVKQETLEIKEEIKSEVKEEIKQEIKEEVKEEVKEDIEEKVKEEVKTENKPKSKRGSKSSANKKKKKEESVEEQISYELPEEVEPPVSLEEAEEALLPIVAPTTKEWEEEKASVLKALDCIKISQDMTMTQVKSCLAELDNFNFEIFPKLHHAETLYDGTKQNIEYIKAMAISQCKATNAESRKMAGIIACKNYVTPDGVRVDFNQYMLIIEEKFKFYSKVKSIIEFKKYSLLNYNDALKIQNKGL